MIDWRTLPTGTLVQLDAKRYPTATKRAGRLYIVVEGPVGASHAYHIQSLATGYRMLVARVHFEVADHAQD